MYHVGVPEAWILLETSMVFHITAEMSALLMKLEGDVTEIEFTMHGLLSYQSGSSLS